ncbi:YkgJ family cysteine cluster protein [Fontisphaera persica]|uniref:YkgJ family cysteine cluster protein n=1 Tax=Fontisphaera persica TaxID=2974023 RepID=UPI0024BF879F|nr:YkgJ family cysteine cluster protein [Fontisphaera persica]WCJ61104.1 YkgJ family cysteine cluster protein [Fontisphaera persica]
MGIYWECQRCTACCQWPGEVKVTEEEICQMAAWLSLSEREFIERYTRLRQDRRGLALVEQEGGACVFLQGRDCLVQPFKPRQCQEFPNGWRASPELMRQCQARPVWRAGTREECSGEERGA